MNLRAWRWTSKNDVSPRWLVAWLVCLTLGLAGAHAQSGSTLQDAKALYDSASFDEALTVLDRIARTQPEADVADVQRYRALCLLALNRTADAQTAIEVVLSRDPLYKLSEGDAPPRMRAAFSEVRRRLLPKVTEQLYTSAKLSFDRKEYALATTQFSDLLLVPRRARRPGAAEPQGIPDARHRVSQSERRGAGDGREGGAAPGRCGAGERVRRRRTRRGAATSACFGFSRQRHLRRPRCLQGAFSCRRWSSGSRCPCGWR